MPTKGNIKFGFKVLIPFVYKDALGTAPADGLYFYSGNTKQVMQVLNQKKKFFSPPVPAAAQIASGVFD